MRALYHYSVLLEARGERVVDDGVLDLDKPISTADDYAQARQKILYKHGAFSSRAAILSLMPLRMEAST